LATPWFELKRKNIYFSRDLFQMEFTALNKPLDGGPWRLEDTVAARQLLKTFLRRFLNGAE